MASPVIRHLGIGIHDIPEAEYHRDPCPEPSLSSSIIHELVEKSPRHAWHKHPRLNPDHEPENKRQFDIGHAAHLCYLGRGTEIVIIDLPDYKTKRGRQLRDTAYENGRTPVLLKEWERVRAMYDAGMLQLSKHELGGLLYCNGHAEETIVWQEGGVWCRARLDYRVGPYILDFKTTGGSAHPDAWERQCFNLGSDIQAAWYLRGLNAIAPNPDRQFLFTPQEIDEPNAISVVDLPPSALDLADRKINYALGWWRWCLEHDSWPGFPKKVATIKLPKWHDYQWEERLQQDDQAILTDAYKQLMIDWQSPIKDKEDAA